MNRYSYACVRKVPPIMDYGVLCQYSKLEKKDTFSEIEHPGIKFAAQLMKIEKGLEIVTLSDVKSQSGIGSSSSFIISVLNAFHTLKNEKPRKKILAQECNYVERVLAKESGGIADPIAASYGGLISIHIEPDGDFTVRPLPVAEGFIQNFESHLLYCLVSTRQSFEVAKSHDSLKADDHKLRILDLAREMVTAFSEENIPYIANILNKSWEEKKKISDKVSNEEIDGIYQIGIKAGALGGKIMGSGAGGLMVFIVPPNKKNRVKAALTNYRFLDDVGFDFQGSQIIFDGGDRL